MREIKFRAWDGTRMFIVTDISWCACAPIRPVSVEGFTMVDGSSHCAIWDEGDEPDIILMQYTGLLDRNGKEIYEGDILKRRDHSYKHTVKWAGESCGFHLAWVSDSIKAGYQIEVIGNIHEGEAMNIDLLDEIVSAAKQVGYCDTLGDDDRIKVEAEKKLSQLVCKAMTTIAERRCECGVWQADKYCGACGGLL